MRYEDLFKTDPYGYIAFNSGMGAYGASLKVGTRVVPTEWALQNNICKNGDKGVVVGHARSGHSIRIRKDGNKTASSYWGGFWRDKNWKL